MQQPRQSRLPLQQRAQRTRGALLLAAEQEFAQHGHAGATARTIAQRAGVATGSFYQYFSDKDAVLHEIARARADELAERVASAGAGQDASAGIERVVREVVRYHREDRELHAVLENRRHADPELAEITRASEARFVQHIEALLSAMQAPTGDAPDLRARAFVVFGLVEGAVHAHVLGGAMVSDERFERALTDAVLRLMQH